MTTKHKGCEATAYWNNGFSNLKLSDPGGRIGRVHGVFAEADGGVRGVAS